MLSALRSSFHLLDRRDRARWLMTIAASVVISVVEVCAAAMVLVLMQFLTKDPSTVSVPFLGVVDDRWPSLDDGELIRLVSGITACFFLARGLLFLTHAHLQYRVAYGAGVRLSQKLMRIYLAMPYRWHLERNSAHLMTNIVEAVNQVVVYVLVPTGTAISAGLLTVALVAVLLVIDAVSTIAGGVVLGAVVFVVLRSVRPRLGALARREIEGYELSIGTVQEALGGLRDVKIYDLGEQVVARLSRGRSAQSRANYMRSTLTAVPRVVIETAAVLAMLAFLVIRREDASSGDALATLGVFGYALIRLLPTVNTLVTSVNTVQYGEAAAEKILKELALEGEAGAGEPLDRGLDGDLEGDIELRDVGFRYAAARAPSLREVSLRVRPGESIGIVGPTGSGKSTLLDVLAGLLDPTEGTATVNGRPIATCRRAWQHRLGVVPQSVVILNGTLADNIAIGVAGTDVDGARLLAAVDKAQLGSFVASLPDGLDTEVGERGVRLSGGQRQRIAIARALYRRPSVLIFDEGTAALDTATEADLMEAIGALKGAFTLIMVAHRLDTVRSCDRILLVEDGRVTADGPFEALARTSPGFRRLVGEG